MHGLLEQLPSGSRMKLNIWPPLWPTHLCNPRVSTRVRAQAGALATLPRTLPRV